MRQSAINMTTPTTNEDAFSNGARDQSSQPRSVTEVVIVSSPKAGTGAGRDQIPALIKTLTAQGINAQSTTSIAEMKSRVLMAAAEGRTEPVIVAAGGDGTLALVADNVSQKVPLVPMPMGTENLLARYFGHTNRCEQVANTILHGSSYYLDAGRANGQLFLVMASCGFDAEVVRGLHLTRRGHINRWSYARPMLRAVRRYGFPKLRVCLDGQADKTFDCGWAMAFNLPRYGGGLSIEPDAIGNDGQLDVIAFLKGSVLSGLSYVSRVALGRHLKSADVSRMKAKTITITSDRRVPYQLDGDYVGRLPLKIETLPAEVHLLIP